MSSGAHSSSSVVSTKSASGKEASAGAPDYGYSTRPTVLRIKRSGFGRIRSLGSILLLPLLLIPASGQTVWRNTAADFNNAANWTLGLPSGSQFAQFSAATASFNPALSANISVLGLQFDSGTAAWTFTGTGAVRTLSIGTSGIVSNGANTQTFNNANLAIALTANTAFTSNSSGALTFGSTLSSFSNGGFTLTLNGTSTNAANSIAEPIAGTGGLTKSGSGTWTLTGANTYTGVTTINAGTLSVATINNGGAAGNLGQATNAAANLVLGGGTLQYTGATASTNRAFTLTGGTTSTIDVSNAANTLTISGASATSTGSLTKAGAGTLVLSGTNQYTGVTTISAGNLSVSTINNGGVAGNLGNASSAAANLVLGGGTLIYTGATASTNRGFTLTDATTSTINVSNAANTLTISGAAANTTGNLTKTGAGTLTLSGTNQYTGVTTINAGTLSVSTINNGGVAGNLGNASNAAGNLVLGGGTLQYTGATASTDRGFTLTAATTSTFDVTANNLTISGSAAATTGRLTKTGAGTLTLSGTNQYTGITTINAGTLSVSTINNGGVAGNLGAATNANTNLVLGGGTLQYTGATASTNRAFTLTAGTTSTIDVTTNNLTISGASANTNGSLTKAGNGTLTLSAANAYTGTTTVNAGTLAYGINNALSSGAVVVSGGTLDIGTFTDTVGAVTLSSGSIVGSTGILTGTSYAMQSGSVSAILAGAVALNKTTAGTVTLSGTNQYTGVTTISAGTLSVATINNGGVAGNLGNATAVATNLVLGGGTLQYTGATASTNRALTLTAATTSSIDVTTNNLTISGAIANTTGSLTKIGNGTLTLSGTNLYTGITTINAGTLSVATINNGGTAGNLGNATNAAANLVLGGGTLQYTGITASTDRAFTLTAGTTSTIDVTTNNLTISGASAATNGNLIKAGNGTLTLSGANAYTGNTTVTAGTLAYGANNALATGAVIVSGGTLSIGSFSDSVGAVSLVSGSITGSTGVLTGTSYDVQSGTLSASLGGSGTLTKSTSGTVTLSGNSSTYTGTFSLGNGTLLAASNNALGTGTGNSTISSGAALGLSGAGLSVSNGNATITIAGNGVSNSGAVYNVSGSNTLNSSLTLSAAARLGSAAGTLTLGPTAPSFTVSGHTQPTESSFITLGDSTSGSDLTFSGAGNIVVNARIRDYAGQTAGMSFSDPNTVAYKPVAPSGTAGNVTIDMASGSASVTYQANANSYTGTTFVKNGTLILNTKNNTVAPHDTVTDSFHAINGPLVIGNGGTSATVRINSLFGPNEPLAINTPVTLYNDGTLDLNGAGTTIDTLTFVNGGTVLTGGGTLYLNNNVTFNSTANGQTAKIGNSANDGTLSLELNKSATNPNPDPDNGVGATRTFTINPVSAGNNATLTVNSTVIRGDVVKNGDGTLVFNGNNTYLGTTTVNAGIFSATRGDDASFFSAFGAADGTDAKGTTVASGATVQLSGGITIAKEKLNLNGEGFNNAGALQNVSGNNTWGNIGNINLVTNSRINSDAGLLTITSNITSTGNDKALKIGGEGNTTISGQISTGSGATTTLTKDGNGTLTLSGSNGYQGNTSIQAGIVVAANNNALGSAVAGTTVSSGAELRLTNNITIPGEATTLNGTGFQNGGTGALRNFSGSNTYQGTLTIGSSGTRINSDTGNMTLTGGITTSGNAFTVGGAGNTTVTGSVGGLGALTKDGAGTANFSGTVGLGDITMNAGTLGFSNGISTVGGNVTVNAGTVNFTGAGNSTTVGQVSLLGTSTINVGSSTTINTSEFASASNSTLNIATGGVVNATYNVGNTVFSGDITGGGTFKALGTGQVTFNEDITNTALTVFIGGTSIGTMASPLKVTITNTADLSFGTLRITGDTILDFGNSSASSLTSVNLLIDAGVMVTVQNWISMTDFWKVTSSFSQTSGAAAVPDALGFQPENQITFTGFSNNSTSWITIGTYPSYFDKEIRPVPEPSTYGALFLASCGAFLGYRRYRQRAAKK